MHDMEVNWKVGATSGGLKCQFSRVEGDKGIWIYKRSLNQFPFQRRKHQGRRLLWWNFKDENEKGEKVGKNLVDGEALHLIILRGKMGLKFAKNA
jgi:hypothetical protein